MFRRRTKEEESALLRIIFAGPVHVVLHDGRIIVAVITESKEARATFFTSAAERLTVSYSSIVSAHPCVVGDEHDVLLEAMKKAGMILE